VKGNRTNKKGKKMEFVVSSEASKKGYVYLSLNEDENSFMASNYFPKKFDQLSISKLSKKGRLLKPDLNVQFFPSVIPRFNKKEFYLNTKPGFYAIENPIDAQFQMSTINDVEELDPVEIKANLEERRIEKIKNKNAAGRAVFLNRGVYDNLTLAAFLSMNGLIVNENRGDGTLSASFSGTNNLSGTLPAFFYLDDFPVFDTGFFYQYFLTAVDYIVLNREGFGEGLRGGGGVIRIYTDPYKLGSKANKINLKKIKFPLTFSKSKKFYSPKYSNYYSRFYKQFGVIDWLPQNSIDKNGDVFLRFENKSKNSFKLFIEGINSNGDFIFEERIISVD
jgi:hypothetical protein